MSISLLTTIALGLITIVITNSIMCEKEKEPKQKPTKLGWTFSFCAIGLLCGSITSFGTVYGWFSSEAYTFQQFLELADYIQEHTNEDDTILALPRTAELYFLSKRMPASKNFVYWEESLIPDINPNAPPTLVVFFEVSNQGITAKVSEEFDSFVKQNYDLIKVIELNPPAYRWYNYAYILKLKEGESIA